MPCRCDDYYDREPTQSTLDELASEHERRCHAQSLVNKLACILEKNGILVEAKIAKSIASVRADLLTHKREELKKDLGSFQSDLSILNGKMKQIKSLGGIVSEQMSQGAELLKSKIQEIHNMTDAQVLGDETT